MSTLPLRPNKLKYFGATSDSSVQFVGDNDYHNRVALDGSGTFHGMVKYQSTALKGVYLKFL